jgi:phospholipase C
MSRSIITSRPTVANPPGEPAFTPLPGTPGLPGEDKIDTLASAGLIRSNPNKTNPLNGADAALPFRLDITQAATADQDHGYTAEQAAFDHFKMDLFPLHTGRGDEAGAGAFSRQSSASSKPTGYVDDR